MDAFFLPFLIAALGEIGDKTQLLVLILAARFGRPAPVLMGVGAAALANAAIAATGGALIEPLTPHRATALMVGASLLLTGVAAFWLPRARDVAAGWRLGAAGTSFVSFLILQFGDKTQLSTAAFAAWSGAPVAVAIGAAAGVITPNVPAAVIGPALARGPGLRIARAAAGAMLVIGGFITAISAMRLI